MPLPVPPLEKLNVYHMVHVDRLESILRRNALYSDLTLAEMGIEVGTSIAYENIRERRRTTIVIGKPDLVVGGCVPFYFGKHTPMLLRAKSGPSAGYEYDQGQEPIVYLVFRMCELIREAERAGLYWFFTDGNAAAALTDQFSSLADLNKLNWEVIAKRYWGGFRDQKQAEFLVEREVALAESFLGAGVMTCPMQARVLKMFAAASLNKPVLLKDDWYFPEVRK